MAAGLGAVHPPGVARLEARDAGPDRRHLARGLDTDHLRHLALGEGHTAKAPDVEIIEPNRPHPHLHLGLAGRRRGLDLGQAKVAVAEELKRAHRYRCTPIIAVRPPSIGSTAPVM